MSYSYQQATHQPPTFRGRGLLRWSVTDSYLLALARLHNHPGHTNNNNRRDIDPLPGHFFLPLRGSSNTDLTAVTTQGIQERVQLEVNGQYGLMSRCSWARRDCPHQKNSVWCLFDCFNQRVLTFSWAANSCGHVKNDCPLSRGCDEVECGYSSFDHTIFLPFKMVTVSD